MHIIMLSVLYIICTMVMAHLLTIEGASATVHVIIYSLDLLSMFRCKQWPAMVG